MTPPRGLRIGLSILALASMAPVAEAEKNYWPLAAAVLCAIAGEFLRTVRRRHRVPIAFTLVLSAGCVVYLCAEMFLVREPVPAILALSHFLVFLACCKLIEPMQTRDMGVLLVISLLMLVIGGLTSGSVVYAAVLALNLTYGMYWLIRFHQHRELAAVGALASPSTLPGLRTIAAAFVVSFMLATAALAAFVLTPRGLSRQLFGRLRSPIAAAVTGYTDQIELQSGGLRESDAPVMRVRLTCNGAPVGGEGMPLYLRGRTFECYTRGRWLTRSFAPLWRFEASSFDEPRVLSAAYRSLLPDMLVTLNVWLEPNKGPSLFCLYPPLAVSAGETVPIAQNCDDYSLTLRNYRRQAVHYLVVSPASMTPRVARTLDSEYAVRAEELGGPRRDEPLRRADSTALTPRSSAPESDIPAGIERLARQIVAPVGNPDDAGLHRDMAVQIERHLKSEPFEYTLEPVSGYARGDRLEQFLTTTHRGHCEFFAAAMTALCQSVGIPARLVSGYYGGEYNSVGAFYVVRQKDAHAWVEVFLPDRGWTVFDPSPAAPSRQGGDGRGLWTSLVRIGQYLQFEWVTFVVSFDAEYRRQIFGAFEHWFLQIDESRSGLAYAWDLVVAFLRGPPELQPRQRVLYWIVLALVLLMVALILRLCWKLLLIAREFLPRRGDDLAGPREPDARFYDRMLLLLRRRGYPKPPNVTPREFAVRVAEAEPDIGEIVQCTDWFYEAQYGRRSLDRNRRAAVRSFLDYLREGPSWRDRLAPDESASAESDTRGGNGDYKIRRD